MQGADFKKISDKFICNSDVFLLVKSEIKHVQTNCIIITTPGQVPSNLPPFRQAANHHSGENYFELAHELSMF